MNRHQPRRHCSVSFDTASQPTPPLKWPVVLTSAESDRLRVVLVSSRNPLNIGAAARAMANFGFHHLRVVHPYDVAFREARSAVNAEPVLQAAGEFANVADAIADCALVVGTTAGTRRTPQQQLHRLEAAATIIRQHLQSGSKVALLFGSEKIGLSNQDLSHCQLLLRIPTQTEHPSMNLGQAVAILLYELVRQPSEEPTAPIPEGLLENQPEKPLATAEERERLTILLLEILALSGYARHPSPEEKVRSLMRHLPLTQSDVHHWLGLLRHILWKLKATPQPPAD
jgi:tRNA/rRNA methyltransferase